MASQQPLAEGRHNHPPGCCCTADLDPTGSNERIDCPACPEHGQLATVECPQCHQTAGRPHTDYCTLAPDRVWADMGELPYPPTHPKGPHGTEALPPACTYPHLNHGDGRGCETDDCPRHGYSPDYVAEMHAEHGHR